MLKSSSVANQSTNFNLKNEFVQLIGAHRKSERVFMTIEALEALRTKQGAVPASKHGLETICGASCETGAQ